MSTWRRRTVLYLAGIAAAIALFTGAYNVGMAALEGRPQSVLRSLAVVVETFTTVGYGSDAPWSHPAMYALVITMELTGVGLIFLTLPAFVFPLFEEMMATTVPTAVERADHVVFCGFSSRDETLVEELDSQGVDYVVLAADEDRARALRAEGHTVVHGDPETTEALRGACVPAARAVVVDAGDESNAAITLSVREVAPDVRTVSYVEEPAHREYLDLAGADHVVSPRTVLGESIAGKVTSTITADLDAVEIGEDFEIVEIPVQNNSPLDGVSLSETPLSTRAGANVVGAWFGGEFVASPDPERAIDRSTVLLVAGSRQQLSDLVELTRSERLRPSRDRVVIAGHGEVGSTVQVAVERSGTETTVVDLDDGPHVDVVGDATEAATLRRADVASADALILALPDDTTTVFATLVGRELVEDVEIIARADAVESVPKLYAAGADYVLALATVSGRMLTSSVLDEDVVSLETNVEIVRTAAPALAGQTLADADVRARTGATVIAVEREGSVVTRVTPDFELRAGDAVVVAGTDEAVRRFTDLADAPGGRS